MEKNLVAGFGFEGMADGVSEIENFAQAVLFFVLPDYFGLDAHRLGNQPLQRAGILGQNLLAILLHELEDARIADDSRL